ncbi:uncharacterized protein LOC123881189 [Maniola jurtina]|uniref:uncharacterized protein LOC123881189 n=1 Tax=Maniola jurtina TaxID=191418 RepID=UPI001E68ADD6|nr:uncharacterized protein LOC123881189 [Maniola jurtina]
MYIAQSWLFGMVLAMWIGLCLIDICLKDSAHMLQLTEFNKLNEIMAHLLENSSSLIQQKSFERKENKIRSVYQNKSILLQYITFIATTCLVLTYYRKKHFMLDTIMKIKTVNKHEMKQHCMRKVQTLKFTAKSVGVAILKILKMSMGKIEQLRIYITKYKQQSTSIRNPQNVNLILLNKLKEYSHERRNLGHILFATMQENKNIRMQYTLEALAKKRLVRQIEDTQKQMKENRSRYLGFQQLYTIAHQENNFLKSRIRKLTQDKEEAERNLIKLVNYVWQSKHNELKAYCSRLIVKTKNDLLSSDPKLEIDRFLKQSSKVKHRISDQESNKSHSLDTIKEVNENREETDLSALVKDAPKLRGLPGECVWTVKDKDGFIEKLYEYDTDLDNGETIRKIRQYSVYYDKDCLLDISSSTSSTNLIQSTNIDLSDLRRQYINKCITGSQAFQTFLKNNKIIVLSRTRRSTQRPQLTY